MRSTRRNACKVSRGSPKHKAFTMHAITFNAVTVAAALRAAGFAAARAVGEADEITDGTVHITDLVHVQVGVDYLSANKWVDEGTALVFGPMRDNLRELIADLRATLLD